MTIQFQCLINKRRKMNLIRMYNTNEDVLVVRKSDYQNNNIGDGYFLVPKYEAYRSKWVLNSL